jgi:leader peptidase (prepilin peptidase)/N-methyltransferase
LLTLVWVDALTTWLPTQLLRLVAGELAVALLIGAVLSPTPVTLLSRVLVGALASGVVFTTLWWFTRGFGFGDVRLAPLIGAVAGSLGSSGWYAALLAGSLVGVVWGLAARRHPAPGTSSGFAYGPALWCGPYLAYALCQLVQASS